jgi:hypothetical protein
MCRLWVIHSWVLIRGGGDDEDNTQAVCKPCHDSTSAMAES